MRRGSLRSLRRARWAMASTRVYGPARWNPKRRKATAMEPAGIRRTWDGDIWRWRITCRTESSSISFLHNGSYEEAVREWAKETKKLRRAEIQAQVYSSQSSGERIKAYKLSQLDSIYGANHTA